MPKEKEIGVITEQGFVAGNGLGFNPVSENELNPNNSDNGNEETKDRN